MLPVSVHHRGGSSSGAHPPAGNFVTAAFATSGGSFSAGGWGAHAFHKPQRSAIRRLIQGVLLLCLCVSVWLTLVEPPSRLAGAPAPTPSHKRRNPWPWPSAAMLGLRQPKGSSKQLQQQEAAAQAGGKGRGGRAGRKVMAGLPPLPGSHLKHLILVAGHAVYVGRDYSEAAHESSWFLEDYQQVPGEAASFLEHIRLGIQEAAADPDAMLLFSGGQTRLAAGPRSEGLSYWVVAEAASWFSAPHTVRQRTFTEEHARDSFENLLFSLCRFYELSGHYPDQVTVVSYTLKQARFLDVHRAALRFPVARFRFIGNDVPPDAKGAQAGEARTVAAWRTDPYGCEEGGELLDKKLRRDPFAVGPPHPSRCPALAGLLLHCGPDIYDGPLPWDPKEA